MSEDWIGFSIGGTNPANLIILIQADVGINTQQGVALFKWKYA